MTTARTSLPKDKIHFLLLEGIHPSAVKLLHEQGIATRPGTHAVHLLGLYRQRFGYAPGDCPVAAACDANTMAIPLHNRMDASDYARVATALRAIG